MINFFIAELEPLNEWAVLFLLQHQFDIWHEIVFGGFMGDVAVGADFAADAVQHIAFTFSPEKSDYADRR